MDAHLEQRAKAWLAHDPDDTTRAELEALLARASTVGADADAAATDLAERFSGPLEFGTAGLRGLLGAGESRMNRAVVLRATHGLGLYLLEQLGGAAKELGVVIGYDGRKLGREFAEDAAGALAALGIRALFIDRPTTTPLTAFAVNALACCAGIMVTASHNPPEYNGYKVYWGNGAQIIPPHDTGIAAKIAGAPAADAIPRVTMGEGMASGRISHVERAIDERYLADIVALSVRSDGVRDLPIVYTALHGTGARHALEALESVGFTAVHSVPEQQEPDGAFPTVVFPNPEEKGAMDLSLALAERVGAELVLANDPDADRLAVAVRGRDGRVVQLTGNEVGVLLGHYLLTEGKQRAAERLVLASCVSSPMLGRIAVSMGVRYEETLTGFKWIANRAMELERTEDIEFVFGYEEALGYTAGDVVRDKDGVSSAMLAAELAAVLKAEGKTMLDRLDELSREYGLHLSGQRSLNLTGATGMAKLRAVMDGLRAAPPSAVGGIEVTVFDDFRAGVRRARSGAETALTLPRTDMLWLHLADESRLIVRPSGTEPKLKIYFDLKETVAAGEPVAAAKARCQQRMAALAEAFMGALKA